MKKKKKKNNIQEDVIKAMRKANREIELERNGGRWIAVNRPHKNKKKYDRKRDSKVDLESLYFLPLTFFARSPIPLGSGMNCKVIYFQKKILFFTFFHFWLLFIYSN